MSVASLTAGLSAAGHVVGGGQAPHPLAVLILAGLAAVPPAYLLGGRRLTFVRLLGLLAAGQLLIHWVLSTPAGGADHAHAHAAPDVAMLPAGGSSMVCGHAVATLVLGLLLANGEALLWLLWELLRPLLALPGRVVLATVDVRLPAFEAGFPPVRSRVWAAVAPRGPPRLGEALPTFW